MNGITRRSYVLPREGVAPAVAMEYVSGTGAEEVDDTPHSGKFWVYEQEIEIPYYIIQDPTRKTL